MSGNQRIRLRPFRCALASTAAVLVIVIGASMHQWITIQREREAINKVVLMGGWYDVRDSSPKWLAKLIGPARMSCFDRVVIVMFGNNPVTDTRCLERFTKLESLDLSDTNIGDDNLEDIKNLTHLKELNLCRTQVTSDGLIYLDGLHNLATLDLSNTKVSDDGLPHISGLARLDDLNLEGTRVTDRGLSHLVSIHNVTLLNLYNTKVTEEGVARLQAALPECVILAD